MNQPLGRQARLGQHGREAEAMQQAEEERHAPAQPLRRARASGEREVAGREQCEPGEGERRHAPDASRGAEREDRQHQRDA